MEDTYRTKSSWRRLLLIGGFALASTSLPSLVLGSALANAAVLSKPHAAKIKDVVYAQSVPITSLATAGTQPQSYRSRIRGRIALYSGLVRFKSNLTFEQILL